MRYQVKNWKDHQHYKDRRPPWIKLHRTLLDDCAFLRLQPASRALAPLLWLLASERNDGIIDGGAEEIAYRLRLSPKEVESGLSGLESIGYITRLHDASTGLASCKQQTRLETETETETETEGDIRAGQTGRGALESFGEFGKVRLSESEYSKLVVKHGKDRADAAIEILDGYIASKNRRYANHYAVLKEGSWVWERLDKRPDQRDENGITEAEYFAAARENDRKTAEWVARQAKLDAERKKGGKRE